MTGLIILIVIVVASLTFFLRNKKQSKLFQFSAETRQLLYDNVAFYRELSETKKSSFEARVQDFLSNVTIRGIDVQVDDLDKLLIASGAIMLIFSFPDWKYNNISEVLVYESSFNRNFETGGADAHVLGMVGDGALHRVMLLSKQSLRLSFARHNDGENTVVHEFAHLLDKADGLVDGVPEYLLQHAEVIPWATEVKESIAAMRRSGRSDIDMYGATNDAEFFAVVAEYFFEKPDKLNEKHPQLFALLQQMFAPKDSPDF
jgi:hypothetical protein